MQETSQTLWKARLGSFSQVILAPAGGAGSSQSPTERWSSHASIAIEDFTRSKHFTENVLGQIYSVFNNHHYNSELQ